MIRRRVLTLDTANRKLLWKQALENATRKPAPEPLKWWQVALAWLDRVWL